MSYPVVTRSFEELERLLGAAAPHVLVAGELRGPKLLRVRRGTRLEGLPGNRLVCGGLIEPRTRFDSIQFEAYPGAVYFPAGEYVIYRAVPGFVMLTLPDLPASAGPEFVPDSSPPLRNVIPLHSKGDR